MTHLTDEKRLATQARVRNALRDIGDNFDSEPVPSVHSSVSGATAIGSKSLLDELLGDFSDVPVAVGSPNAGSETQINKYIALPSCSMSENPIAW